MYVSVLFGTDTECNLCRLHPSPTFRWIPHISHARNLFEPNGPPGPRQKARKNCAWLRLAASEEQGEATGARWLRFADHLHLEGKVLGNMEQRMTDM